MSESKKPEPESHGGEVEEPGAASEKDLVEGASADAESAESDEPAPEPEDYAAVERDLDAESNWAEPRPRLGGRAVRRRATREVVTEAVRELPGDRATRRRQARELVADKSRLLTGRGPGSPAVAERGGLPRDASGRVLLTGPQRLLILDSWFKSGLAATDFGDLFGISSQRLNKWKLAFEAYGPAGLEPRKRERSGSQLAEATKRAVVLMKEQHPEWGVQRLHDELLRGAGYAASPSAILDLLKESGWESDEVPTQPHEDSRHPFERPRPNFLWQSDLFTFTLKRQNMRVYLVGYLDDHSRFLVGFGLHASASGALVRETLLQAITNYGAPEELLTDNGTQYVTWRGRSEFTKLLERRGIKHIVARPRHPQTLGKIERFWGTMWREFLQAAVFRDLAEARVRLGHFVDHYNFQRPNQGIGGMVPADRFFSASEEVKKALRARVAMNALELAQHGAPRKTFYLTGRVGDSSISLHGEGERVVLTKGDGTREEVDLSLSGRRAESGEAPVLPAPLSTGAALADAPGRTGDAPEPAPGTSPLDEVLSVPEDDEEDEEDGDEGGGEPPPEAPPTSKVLSADGRTAREVLTDIFTNDEDEDTAAAAPVTVEPTKDGGA